ncbi:Cation/acetate symporter ActP [Polystyrenella longa]|uniref:Cation/acetate symporter ActP n=1 Tax=Polystyrenella longa TaxID=2528007 RepID=A0A518CNA5_9PLAN|nr:cation acetate symporter [Polystyrenella longa]QDU80693.1 Cation/acetate symporter ActP [Polystyrenella longa]
MIYEPSALAVVIFGAIVAFTLWLSFFLGSKAKSSAGFFAAGGSIPWFINGVAFAGDYLSAASFLGICGMISFYGYDGFLYSIGYLAGWIVALFVVAEPLKRMGKYTFADALDSRFQSRGIKFTVAISTLVVSIFYLIPQMVGAGALITPLLGFPHYVGVLMVGLVVTIIVVTAGMVSTTYVQFIKGSLLVVFSFIITIAILLRGFSVPQDETDDNYLKSFGPYATMETIPWDEVVRRTAGADLATENAYEPLPNTGNWTDLPYMRVKINPSEEILTWKVDQDDAGGFILREAQFKTVNSDQAAFVNGLPQGKGEGQMDLKPIGQVKSLLEDELESGPQGPLQFFRTIQDSTIMLNGTESFTDEDGAVTTIFYQKPTSGTDILSPGNHPSFQGLRGDDTIKKINFLSLMLALFCGTASLPHILIRYYTVKDQASARKSTIVGIGSIGFFYVLTLFMGLGAMTSGQLDPTNSNMAAPLLAKSINEWLFAIISAIAFTTVLGTVSGLIIAASGAVVHDLLTDVLKIDMTDHSKVRIGKMSAVVVGIIAIILGILFEKMNVNYLVGWAFSIAASANLPALLMVLFWKRTTKQGITAAVTVGMISSLGWVMTSADTFSKVYGIDPELAWVPFSQPGIVTIPLGFLTLIVVSLMTQPKEKVAV